MRIMKLVMTGFLLLFLTIVNSGCAALGAAISAGIAYGIYQATQK